MTLIRWEPFRELDDLFGRHGSLFGHRAAAGARPADTASGWLPAANISETDAEFLIRLELPEVARDAVEVTVDGGVISISGERRNTLEHTGEKLHRVESSYGSFQRSFSLPDGVDVDGIRAESRDGMLKVRIPKLPAARPRSIKVEVN